MRRRRRRRRLLSLGQRQLAGRPARSLVRPRRMRRSLARSLACWPAGRRLLGCAPMRAASQLQAIVKGRHPVVADGPRT